MLKTCVNGYVYKNKISTGSQQMLINTNISQSISASASEFNVIVTNPFAMKSATKHGCFARIINVKSTDLPNEIFAGNNIKLWISDKIVLTKNLMLSIRSESVKRAQNNDCTNVTVKKWRFMEPTNELSKAAVFSMVFDNMTSIKLARSIENCLEIINPDAALELGLDQDTVDEFNAVINKDEAEEFEKTYNISFNQVCQKTGWNKNITESFENDPLRILLFDDQFVDSEIANPLCYKNGKDITIASMLKIFPEMMNNYIIAYATAIVTQYNNLEMYRELDESLAKDVSAEAGMPVTIGDIMAAASIIGSETDENKKVAGIDSPITIYNNHVYLTQIYKCLSIISNFIVKNKN